MLHDARKFLRFGIFLNLEIKPTKDATEYLSGITRNFSYEGFSFVSQSFDFEPQEAINVRIQHPREDTFVAVTGNIIWKREVSDRCFAGIKIREMDKEAKNEILDYAHDRWLEEMEKTPKANLKKFMSERQRKRILVIDDDLDTCNLISYALEAKGYEVIKVLDPEKAIEIAKEIEPKLIFISLALSGSSGLKISKSIRSIESLKTAPIFLMISRNNEFDKRYASFLGISDIIVKPVNIDEFVSETLKNLGEDTFPFKRDEIFQAPSVEGEARTFLSEENPDNVDETEAEIIRAESKFLETPEEKIIEPEEEDAEKELDEGWTEGKQESFSETKKSPDRKLSLIYVIVIIFAVLGAIAFLFKGAGQKSLSIFLKETSEQKELVKKDTITETVLIDNKKKDISSASVDVSKKRINPPEMTSKQETDQLFPTKPKPLEKKIYSVHLGAFLNEKNAVSFAGKLKQKGYDAFIQKDLRTGKKTMHRVLIGTFDNQNKALEQAKIIRQKEGFESFVYYY